MSLSGSFPFDPRRFWGDEDVLCLDWPEIGVYLRLLSCQWEEGDIPNDKRKLAALLAGGLRAPVSVAQLDTVLSFFEEVEGDKKRLRHPKMQQDREEWIAKKADFIAKKSAAGKASGEARRRKKEQVLNTCSTPVEQKANTTGTNDEQTTNKRELPSPSSSPSPSLYPEDGEEKKPVGDRSDLATDLEVEVPPSKKTKGPSRAEISWRVADTWVHFLERRARYYQLAKGMAKPPGVPPTLEELIKTDIRRALRVHDADLLETGDREAWQRDSKVRAAGGGMYLTPYNLGKREENDDDGNGKRATTYLEAWRPWRIRKGRDPVNEYAETYFEKRAVAEAAEEAERTER